MGEAITLTQLRKSMQRVAETAVLHNVQTLTDEQKAQARKNIGATTVDDVVSGLEGALSDVNEISLMDGVTWSRGYIDKNGGRSYSCLNGEALSGYVPVEAGFTYTIKYSVQASNIDGHDDVMWCNVSEYDASRNHIRSNAVYYTGEVIGERCICMIPFTPSETTAEIRISARTYPWSYGSLTSTDFSANSEGYIALVVAEAVNTVFLYEGEVALPVSQSRLLPMLLSDDDSKVLAADGTAWTAKTRDAMYANPHIRAVAHRGYSTDAPENTLSAFRLAKKKGFECVECDVSFTSDNVAVLLHDSTVDRTSDGTGAIAEMTLEAVRALDFGSWKSEDYAGEPIPTFEEFIILCKRLGLHPYIELKGTMSDSQIASLIPIVRRYGMLRGVTWISSKQANLNSVATHDTDARLGYVVETVSDNAIEWVTTKIADGHDAFLDASYAAVTSDIAQTCANNNIPLEVWTVNTQTAIAALDPYVSGYTSNGVRANVALYDIFGR